MKRIKTCAEAVVLAGNVCQSWRVMSGEQKLNLIDMLTVAEQMDEENPTEEDFYYLVSTEGAIGITWKWEFLVNWLYVPEEAFEEEPVQGQPIPTAASPQPEVKRFCSKCGKPLLANARFCRGCGTPI